MVYAKIFVNTNEYDTLVDTEFQINLIDRSVVRTNITSSTLILKFVGLLKMFYR